MTISSVNRFIFSPGQLWIRIINNGASLLLALVSPETREFWTNLQKPNKPNETKPSHLVFPGGVAVVEPLAKITQHAFNFLLDFDDVTASRIMIH